MIFFAEQEEKKNQIYKLSKYTKFSSQYSNIMINLIKVSLDYGVIFEKSPIC